MIFLAFLYFTERKDKVFIRSMNKIIGFNEEIQIF